MFDNIISAILTKGFTLYTETVTKNSTFLLIELIPKLKIAFLNLCFKIVNRSTDKESNYKLLYIMEIETVLG